MNILSKITTGIRKFFDFTLDFYVYLILIIVFLVTLYPFWYILVYSLSDPSKLTTGFLLIPAGFSLQSYISTFSIPSVYGAFLVSVARSVIGPFASTLVSMLVAYALSRSDLPGRKFFTWYFVLTMYFGAGLIPTYIIIKSLGLVGSFWVYIIPTLMNVYGMILIRTYIETLPESLQESAYIDGANELVIFYKIIVPLCKPVIAAILLLECVNHWNNYTDTLIFNSSKSQLYTLQYVLVTLVSTAATNQSADVSKRLAANAGRVRLTPMAIRMAVTMITVIPISLAYPFLQKYFIKGIMIGAVKG
jgi:putative aldouronate transport system permease protein